MGVFVDVAVAEGYSNEPCAEVIEVITLGESWVVESAAFFVVGDAADLGDVGGDGVEGLVGGVEEEVEGVAVEVVVVFGGPEFVGNSSGLLDIFAGVGGELVEELSELGFVDIEVALGGSNVVFFHFGFKVDEFVFVGVEPVVGVGGFAPEVEDIVVDGETEFFSALGEVETLGDGACDFSSVFFD